MFGKYKRNTLKWYVKYGCLIVSFAFFVWAETRLLLEDGKNQQMMEFQVSNEAFRKLNIQKRRFEELKKFSEQSRMSFEKLLAVSFLRNHFHEASYESAAVLITELAAYERRNPPVFNFISSCYLQMISPIAVHPLPYIISDDGKRKTPWMETGWDEETWTVYFEMEETWAEGLPVFCVEQGEVYDFDYEAGTFRIKGKNEILYAYYNLNFDRKQWKAGEEILAGEMIGWVRNREENKKTVKLRLQFLLSSENGMWIPYNGVWSVLDDDTKHYNVTQKLPQ